MSKKNPEASTLLLIGGLSRSGTTMLQKLCNNHPQISISFESKAFLNTGKRFSEYYRNLRKSKNRLDGEKSEKSILSKLIYFWRVDLQIYRRGYRKVTIANIHEIYQSLFPNVTVVGDKFPRYLWHLPKLTAYDGIRIVIIYRDGRDVAQSIYTKMRTAWEDKKWAQKNYSNFANIATRWVQSIRIMEKNSDDILIIRYEEFVTNPKVELARLAEYLKVDPVGFDYEMITSGSVGKYKEILTDDQIAEVIDIAGPTLERLGYMDSHRNENSG